MYLQHSAQVCCTDKSSLQWHFLHLHLQYYTEYSQWLVTISVNHKPNCCSSSFLVHCSPLGGLRFPITTCAKTFSFSFRSRSAIVLHQISSRVPWAQLCLLNCPLQGCTQFPGLVKGKGRTPSSTGPLFSHRICARDQQYETARNKRLVYAHLRTWNSALNASLASWESWEEIIFHCSKRLNSKIS